jgi:hypothetical protein
MKRKAASMAKKSGVAANETGEWQSAKAKENGVSAWRKAGGAGDESNGGVAWHLSAA